MWTIASGLLTTVDETTSNAKLIGYQLLTGIGTGQTLQITLVAIQAAVPRSAMATVTGTRNFLRMLGSALAVACCATAINNIVRFVSQVISALPADHKGLPRERGGGGINYPAYPVGSYTNHERRAPILGAASGPQGLP